jgi:TRAP-type C4-dicarboxylate transport system permease small subunit
MAAPEATVARPRLARRAWRVRERVLLLPKILLTGLLILAIGDMVVGVFMRYVMTAITDWLKLNPIDFFWVEEVGEYSLTWLTMIGAAVGVAERAHFTLHVLTHRLSLPAQRAIHIATHLLIAGFGALAGWYGIQLAIVNSVLTSPALQLNLAWVYAAPAAGGALIVVYGLATAFEPPPVPQADSLDETGIAAAGDD